MHSHHGCIRALIEANTDQSSKDACGYTFWKYCDEEITKFVEGMAESVQAACRYCPTDAVLRQALWERELQGRKHRAAAEASS